MFERALKKLRWICWLSFGGRNKVDKEIGKIFEDKERLRASLVNAGYDIAGVQRMEDWIEIINERTDRELAGGSNE